MAHTLCVDTERKGQLQCYTAIEYGQIEVVVCIVYQHEQGNVDRQNVDKSVCCPGVYLFVEGIV